MSEMSEIKESLGRIEKLLTGLAKLLVQQVEAERQSLEIASQINRRDVRARSAR